MRSRVWPSASPPRRVPRAQPPADHAATPPQTSYPLGARRGRPDRLRPVLLRFRYPGQAGLCAGLAGRCHLSAAADGDADARGAGALPEPGRRVPRSCHRQRGSLAPYRATPALPRGFLRASAATTVTGQSDQDAGERAAPEQAPPEQIGALRLRPFRLDDYERAIALWRDVGLHLSPSDSRTGIARKLERDSELFLVAEGGDAGATSVGAVMGRYDGRRGWINHLAVAATAQGRGLARRLIACIIHEDRGHRSWDRRHPCRQGCRRRRPAGRRQAGSSRPIRRPGIIQDRGGGAAAAREGLREGEPVDRADERAGAELLRTPRVRARRTRLHGEMAHLSDAIYPCLLQRIR